MKRRTALILLAQLSLCSAALSTPLEQPTLCPQITARMVSLLAGVGSILFGARTAIAFGWPAMYKSLSNTDIALTVLFSTSTALQLAGLTMAVLPPCPSDQPQTTRFNRMLVITSLAMIISNAGAIGTLINHQKEEEAFWLGWTTFGLSLIIPIAVSAEKYFEAKYAQLAFRRDSMNLEGSL